MVAGRSTEGRVATVSTTATTTAITGAAGTFNEEDAGRTIVRAGIPAAATIASVTSDTAAVLSAAATTTASAAAALGAASGESHGFRGWSPESDAESESYTLAANNAGTVPPDRIVNTTTGVTQRTRG